MIAQHQHPSIKCAGDHSRQQPRARNHVKPFRFIMRNRCPSRCSSLPTNNPRCVLARHLNKRWHVAKWSTQMRLNHMQHEAHGGARVNGRATFFKDRHTHCRCYPVGRGSNAKSAKYFWAGGECHSSILTQQVICCAGQAHRAARRLKD